MSAFPFSSMNGTDPVERLEAQLVATARALPYPPTPDLAAIFRGALPARPAARRRPPLSARLGWAVAAILLVLLLGLLAVPAVRAGVLEFLRIGAVRIHLVAPATPTPAPTVTGTPPPTPTPTATPLASVLDLAGQTTLADARVRAGFAIGLPTYPADLGEPDEVFLQDLDGSAVVLVWLEPNQPTQVRLSLHILSSSVLVDKLLKQNPPGFEFTQVNGQQAVWTTGPYLIVARNGNYTQTRLVTGHVLIWTAGRLTYRLETDLPLDEAVRIAESIQ